MVKLGLVEEEAKKELEEVVEVEGDMIENKTLMDSPFSMKIP